MSTDENIIEALMQIEALDEPGPGALSIYRIRHRELAHAILAALKSGAIPIPDDAPGMVVMGRLVAEASAMAIAAQHECGNAQAERDQLRADLVVALTVPVTGSVLGMTNTPCHVDLVRVSEAVRQTGIRMSSYHIVRLIRAGKIPGQRIGARWFVRPTDLITALVHPPVSA